MGHPSGLDTKGGHEYGHRLKSALLFACPATIEEFCLQPKQSHLSLQLKQTDRKANVLLLSNRQIDF